MTTTMCPFLIRLSRLIAYRTLFLHTKVVILFVASRKFVLLTHLYNVKKYYSIVILLYHLIVKKKYSVTFFFLRVKKITLF